MPAFVTVDSAAIDHAVPSPRSLRSGRAFGGLFSLVNKLLGAPAFHHRPCGVMVFLHGLASVLCVLLLMIALQAHEILAAGRPSSVAEFEARLLTVNFVVILT